SSRPATDRRSSGDLLRSRGDPRCTGRSTERAIAAGSVSADTPDHRHRGLEHDLEVPPQRPGRHIEIVELHEVVAGQVVAPRDLPQARDARSHLEAACRPTLDVGLAGDERAGAHDGHVALEDVDELGDLVDARAAQERPEVGDPARLVLLLAQLVEWLVVTVRLGARVLGWSGPGIHGHGTELD